MWKETAGASAFGCAIGTTPVRCRPFTYAAQLGQFSGMNLDFAGSLGRIPVRRRVASDQEKHWVEAKYT